MPLQIQLGSLLQYAGETCLNCCVSTWSVILPPCYLCRWTFTGVCGCSEVFGPAYMLQCTKKFANPRKLLRHSPHQWWLTLPSHYSPWPGEQCFAKNSFMAEYMDSWPQGIKCFYIHIHYDVLSASRNTQRSNTSWWHHDSQNIPKLVNS